MRGQEEGGEKGLISQAILLATREGKICVDGLLCKW